MKPKLRPELEVLMAETEGGPVAYVRDPESLAVPGVPFEAAVIPLLEYLDGTNSVEDIQADLMRRGAGMVPKENLEHLVAALDEWLFLDNETVAAERAARDAYLAADVRPAAHAGVAYPDDAEAARRFLDELLAAAPAPPSGAGTRARPARLLAPHIDLELGAPVHAAAHRALADAPRPDLVVVLGVRHELAARRFIACRKDFATPLGTVPADRGFLDDLEARFGESLLEDELAHRREHSVEFQALWIARHWPEDPPPMVPLLVGSFHEYFEGGRARGEDEVERFLDALRGALAADGRDALVLASVDLSHVGPVYDDPQGLDEAVERALEKADRALLEPVLAGDADAFFSAVAADGNARNVCGVAPIYLTLRLGETDGAGAAAGELLSYDQGRIHPESGSVVSYAAVAYA